MSAAATWVLVVTLLGQGYYSPEEARALFEQANEAYLREDYAAAQEGYEKLLARGYGGPDVLYNLGTTHLARGDIGQAVLALERARRAGAHGPDVEGNLALARARQIDKVEGAAVGEPFLERVVRATPGNGVGWAFLGLWGAGFGLLVVRRLLPRGGRLWALVAGLGLLALAVPAGGLVAAHAYVEATVREAVVVAPTLRAREFPREEAKVSFEVHPGLKVRVMEEAGRYVRIRLPNGLEGWAEREGVAEI